MATKTTDITTAPPVPTDENGQEFETKEALIEFLEREKIAQGYDDANKASKLSKEELLDVF